MSCPVCGAEYIYGPGGSSHQNCQEVSERRSKVDEAVRWLLTDKAERGTEPELVTLLREECRSELDKAFEAGKEEQWMNTIYSGDDA